MTDTVHAPTPQCQELLDQIGAYIDGDLADAVCAELARHLSDCPNCRVVVDTTLKTVRLFRRVGEEETLPAETLDRLWGALAEAGCLEQGTGDGG